MGLVSDARGWVSGAVNRAFSAGLILLAMNPGLLAWADMSYAVGFETPGPRSESQMQLLPGNTQLYQGRRADPLTVRTTMPRYVAPLRCH